MIHAKLASPDRCEISIQWVAIQLTANLALGGTDSYLWTIEHSQCPCAGTKGRPLGVNTAKSEFHSA